MEFALSQAKKTCPFLHVTSASSLRRLSSMPAGASTKQSSILLNKAKQCPVMGQAMAVQKRGVATSRPAAQKPTPSVKATAVEATPQTCKHLTPTLSIDNIMIRDGMLMIAFFILLFLSVAPKPFVPAAAAEKPASFTSKSKHFDYESFYQHELEKKHKDKSYRYFNNINRLAQKFPRAHTARVEDEVTVWCANDYLGMGRSPVLTETMK